MGCFSFICKESALPVASSSFDGDAVKLFLLKDGKVIEEMHGHYDSYGRVFDAKGESFEWDMDWGLVCDLMFSGNESSGIAAVLDKYDEGNIPTKQSEGDPEQGWGENNGGGLKVNNPYHMVYRDDKMFIRRLSEHELGETTNAPQAPSALKNKKKYFRTVIEVEVLSEAPIGDMSIGDIIHEIDHGDFSGKFDTKIQDEELTGKAMADALRDQGSDPEFFQLDDEGEEI